MEPVEKKRPGAWLWVLIGLLVIATAALGYSSDEDTDSTTDTSDPCELPATYEVQSDPDVAPADAYYQRCLDAVSENFNR